MEDDDEKAQSEEDQEDPNLPWTPDDETVNFDASATSLLRAPATVHREAMSFRAVYSKIKMLSSFTSRAGVTSNSVESIARKLLGKLGGQIVSTHKTLQALSGEIEISHSQVDPGLYQCLFYHLRILIHDKHKGNTRHKCDRTECQKYCILPMYARRCFSDTHVQILFQHLRNIITEHGSLLVSGGNYRTESKSALNILTHLTSLDHPSQYNSWDVLLAMSGYQRTILNPTEEVDSKLYGLMFDLIRYNFYERHDGRHVAKIKHASLPWLNPAEYPEGFRNVIRQTTARNNEVSDSQTSRTQSATTNSSASRVASEVTDSRASMTLTASRASGTVTTSSASRALALADLTVSLIALPQVVTSVPPPSYGSVIVIPPSAFHDNDGGLPSYEQVLTDIEGGGI